MPANRCDKILIVDDIRENLYSLENLLCEEGRIILKACSGEEALRIACTEELSLILLDVQMPDMDGFEVAHMLKSTKRTRKVPVVFVTAISKEKKYMLQGLTEGAFDYLYKPLDVEITQAKVRSLLQFYHQQQELERKNCELAELNEQKNYFLGMASHDLRNPLGNIIALAQFIDSEQNKLDKEHSQYIKSIIESGNFMLSLLNDLLDVSKIESGNISLMMKEVDVIQLIGTSINDNRFIAKKKNISLQFSAKEDLPKLNADFIQLRQVLNNLISNAVKFSFPGSYVEITAEQKNQCISISVCDEGQGIPADEVEKAFSPFHKSSTAPTTGEKSTGLGLTIAKKVVEAHKGRLTVNSVPGKGSVFTFTLPLPAVTA